MSGFDPNEYLNEGAFDPHSYVAEEPQKQTGAGPGVVQSAVEHLGNMAAMGYLPQLQALASKLIPDPSADVDAKLKAQGFNIQEHKPTYVEDRDANIKRLKQESDEHPIASAVGDVAGLLSGGAIAGEVTGALGAGAKAAELAKAAKAATVAGDMQNAAMLSKAAMAARMANGVATGAAMGAVANPGDTEGEIDPAQLGARLDNAKTGAITGGTIQGAVEALPYVGKGLGYVARKAAATVSGVPQAEIDNYASKTDKINDLIKQTGGDMTAAADKVRQEVSTGIQKTKAKLTGQISSALEKAPTDKNIDLEPILTGLEKNRAALIDKNQVEEANQLGALIEKVKGFGVDKDPVYGVNQYTGKVSAKDLNNIKGLLQDVATPAYQQNGQIFNYSRASQQAAKYGAATARKILNAAVPEVAEANNQLSAMHSIEDNLNRNLLASGKPDSALFAAGSGQNQRNLKMLDKLGELSGVDAAGRAKDLATARTFANPALLPTDATGKTATRMLLAAGAGHLLAGPVGYAAGALASPAAVKLGTNVANAASPYVNTAANFVRNNPSVFQRTAQGLKTPIQNQSAPETQIDEKTLGIFKQNPDLIDTIADQKVKTALLKKIGRSPAEGDSAPAAAPARGPDAWAQSGLQKLGIQDQAMSQQLLSDPKAKQLLIQASDLSPNSKAMKNIQTQIQKGWGRK